MIHYAPPSALDRFRPRLEPSRDSYGVGPGPLSPVWPRLVAPPPPGNEWEAIANELSAIRREVAMELRAEIRMPFFLSIEHRQVIEKAVAALRAAKVDLHPYRPSEFADWPTPVLPTNVLFGARDLLPILDTVIHVAERASKHLNWQRGLDCRVSL